MATDSSQDLNEILVNAIKYYEKQQLKHNVSSDNDLGLGRSSLKSILPISSAHRKCYSVTTATLYKQLLKTIIQSDRYENDLELVTAVFIQAFHVEAFIFLCQTIQDCKPSIKLDYLLNLLSNYLQNESLTQLFEDQCFVVNSMTYSGVNPLWDQLISLIVSIPERIANKLTGKLKFPFDSENYIDLITKCIMKVLHFVYSCLKKEQDMSLEFMSRLVGRISLAGHGDYMFKLITPQLIKVISNDFLWRKIVTRLIVGIPDRCLESVLKPLLHYITWPGYVRHFLGNQILKKPILKFIVTKKFILIRFFPEIRIIQNCIGYLANEPSLHEVFFETLQNILELWSDATALKRMPYEQHFNLSSALMIATAHLKNIEFKSMKTDLEHFLLNGVQTHISASTESVRTQGMIIGGHLSGVLNPGGAKMDFDFTETVEVKRLLALTILQSEPIEDIITDSLKEICINSPAKAEENNTIIENSENKPALDEEIDSDDDDFTAYDQSNDTKFTKEKQPVYIRDCMEGLIDQTDSNWSLACLENCEKLIKSQTANSVEIAPELAKILLHLENNFASPDYIGLRFRALVTICVTSPKPVATYLTEQFYERNYSIRQRLDILEVLAATSQELSGFKQKIKSKIDVPLNLERTFNPVSNWREIVEKRIDSNTKRISKGRQSKVEFVENNFSDIAGYFFFPLLRHYDRRENTFDLFGQDSYLLARLIYTLGILVNSASNTLVVKNLGKTLLEFLWDLRFHSEVFVRQSVLFSVCMVVLNTLSSVLVNELQNEILEYQQWLQSVILSDPDTECRKLASQVMALLVKSVQEGFSAENLNNK